MESVQSVTRSLLITLMSYPITNDAKEWAELGETTIQTISRQCIGGVMKKRDQPEWSDTLTRPVSPHRAGNRTIFLIFYHFAVCRISVRSCQPIKSPFFSSRKRQHDNGICPNQSASSPNGKQSLRRFLQLLNLDFNGLSDPIRARIHYYIVAHDPYQIGNRDGEA